MLTSTQRLLLLSVCVASSLAAIEGPPIFYRHHYHHHAHHSNPSENGPTVGTHSKGFNGKIWALLVAGSNTYFNYRHQADVCHSYHVLKNHGVSEENIVVMMYDDIAYNPDNKRPGVIINKPNGSDVYAGVPKHYTKDEVTPENFLKVLQGDEELAQSGKKVIKSGPNDHIFVYFTDHGAPGIVAFPNSELTASDLNDALMNMFNNKKYSQMVFYIEACESGSMFENLLPKNINVYATTASNAVESSYACYYDDFLDTYLGDCYSVNWLEDSDAHSSLKSETLENQFLLVKNETNTSHVMQYGDLSMAKLPVSQFLGSAKAAVNQDSNAKLSREERMKSAVPSQDVPLVVTAMKLKKAKSIAERKAYEVEYNSMLAARSYLNHTVKSIIHRLRFFTNASPVDLWNRKESITDYACYEKFLRAFDTHCFDLSRHPYALRFLYVFVNFCNHTPNPNIDNGATIERAITALTEACEQVDVNYRSIL